jgi:hypothetical protein
MSIIIGGRDTILKQVPQDVKNKVPRLAEPLDDATVRQMLEQSIQVLQDENMKGSHILFADIIRLVLALQLSVANAAFAETKNIPQTTPLILT